MTILRGAAQLPLALAHAPDLSRENFVRGASNQAALSLVESWPAWPAPVVVLSGPPGSGKTHLTTIWAGRAGAAIFEAGGLLADAAPGLPPRPLAIENIDKDRLPEATLFHLLNAAGEAGQSALLTSRHPVAEWRVGLADLRSRLRLAAPAALGAPDDALLRAALAKLFADRQLVVDRAVLDYLLARMERSLRSAAEIVAALDREALAAGRQISRPMAAAVLERLGGNGEIHDSG